MRPETLESAESAKTRQKTAESKSSRVDRVGPPLKGGGARAADSCTLLHYSGRCRLLPSLNNHTNEVGTRS